MASLNGRRLGEPNVIPEHVEQRRVRIGSN